MESQLQDPKLFERTVNKLLADSLYCSAVKFDLMTESLIKHSESAKMTKKVEPLLRSDGTNSQPDAVLKAANEKLTIVVDAKLYTTDVPTKVIEKTLDDMNLRKTPYGLLICS